MGSGPSQTTTTQPHLPKDANQLRKEATALQRGLLGDPRLSAGLSAELSPQPQGIAPLTAQQLADINSLQALGQGMSPQEQQSQDLINQANAQLQQLTGGPIGSSPATLAGMQSWNTFVAPTVASSLGASSGGRGGALPAALSQSETAAAVPLIQQEIANREAGVGQAGNLSTLEAALGAQRTGDITTALNAAALPQQNAQEVLTSQFNAQQTLNNFLNQVGLGPVNTLTPLTVGSTGTSISSPGKF